MLCYCSAMAKGKRSGKKPMQQNIEFFALLKKPMEAIGKQIRVPGSYWAGNMTAAEKDTDYFRCASLPCAQPPHISTLSGLALRVAARCATSRSRTRSRAVWLQMYVEARACATPNIGDWGALHACIMYRGCGAGPVQNQKLE